MTLSHDRWTTLVHLQSLVLGYNISLGDCAAAACCRLPLPTGPAYRSLCVIPLYFGLGVPWSISRESKSPPISYLLSKPRSYHYISLTTRTFKQKLKFFSRQILHPHFLRTQKTLTFLRNFHGLTYGSVVSRLNFPLATPFGLSLSTLQISKNFSISNT